MILSELLVTEINQTVLAILALLDKDIDLAIFINNVKMAFCPDIEEKLFDSAISDLIKKDCVYINENAQISIKPALRAATFWDALRHRDKDKIVQTANTIRKACVTNTLPGIKNNPGSSLLELLTEEPNEDNLYFPNDFNDPDFRSAMPGIHFDEDAIGGLSQKAQLIIFKLTHRLHTLTFNRIIPKASTQKMYAFFSKASWLKSEIFIEECSHLLAEHFILAGDFERAKTYLQLSKSPESDGIKAVMLYLFHGHEAALPIFRNSLNLIRADKSKKQTTFDTIADPFYFISLIREGTEKSLLEAKNHLKVIARKEAYFESSYKHLIGLYNAKSFSNFDKEFILKSVIESDSEMDRWFGCFTCAWLKIVNNEIIDVLNNTIIATDNPSLKMLHGESIRLKKSFEHQLTEDEQNKLNQWNDNFTLPMYDMIHLHAHWEIVLSELTKALNLDGNFIYEGCNRLIWEFTIYSEEKFAVQGREQSKLKSGKWSSGKIIDCSKFNYGVKPFPDYYTPQDQKTIEHFKTINPWHSGSKDEDWSIFATLVGHPAVYNAADVENPVEILKGEPVLVMSEDNDEINLTFRPAFNGHRFFIDPEGDYRLRVYEYSLAQIKTAEILDKQKVFPPAALEKLKKTLKSLSNQMAVHTSIAGTESLTQTASVTAGSNIYSRILPKGDTLSVKFIVKPFGEQGPSFLPAQGHPDVFTMIAGQKLHTKRDLKEEAARFESLIVNCPSLLSLSSNEYEKVCKTAEESLQTLLELQESEATILEWPEKHRYKKINKAGFSDLRFNINKHNEWFEVSGELNICEEKVLELKELISLYDGKSKFIAIGTDEFIAITDDLKKRIEDLKAYTEANDNKLLIHSLAVPALENFFSDIEHVTFDKSWKEAIGKFKNTGNLRFEKPENLKAKLREYQLEGFHWLSKLAYLGMGACLADDMGLGKTVEALTIILSRASKGAAFVLAPTSVCQNWYSECKRFTPTLNPILFGPSDRKQTIENLAPYDLVICSYGILQKEIAMLSPINWTTVVLDEAQAIKNMSTGRSQAAMMLRGEFKMLMTGTPIENHLGELWNLFRFLNPGLLGSLNSFIDKYSNPIQIDGDSLARNRLKNLVQPFILRRTKDQVLKNLPPRTEITLQVDLSPEELALYESHRRDAVDKIKNNPNENKAIVVLAEIMKLRRLCCNPSLVAPELKIKSSKLSLLESIVDDLKDNGHKALIFSQFVDHLTIVRDMFDQKNLTYKYLDGSTPVKQRTKAIDEFQDGEADFFLISLRAGGLGLNLTAADYVIHLDPWWNPAVEDQASDRAHRIGQTRPVTIYRLITSNTIEEKIVQLHGKKRGLADDLLKGTDLSGKISTKELFELINKSAVSSQSNLS
ncbi:MAG: ATP-dependent helicase HepA [bacterium ADurb.Bin157]|nr:MAG: ATP-dependent helicase HepA [bacterium ADurb.Bin157]